MTNKLATSICAFTALCTVTWRVEASTYVQTDLVSDVPGLATITDPLLHNSWGLTATATSPFWIANQGTNTSTLYAVSGPTTVTKVTGVNANGFVAIPTTGTGPQGPTGIVSNTTANFLSDHFIFANLNGTISGWATGAAATVRATTTGAVYTGLATGQASSGAVLYAANSAGTGGINVFNSSFTPVTLSGGFVDPNLPPGFVTFNVQNIGGSIYVTYAPSGPPTNQSGATAGQGVVAVFDQNGNFLKQLIGVGSQLASPWGLALAQAGFGTFGGDLLVGNFSYVDSGINAFDPTTGAFLGSIPIDVGGNTPGGLWALMFGTGSANGGDPNTLYFTDGINGEADGLFGAIQSETPLPAALPLFATGLGALGLFGWRRKRKAKAVA